MKIFIDSADLVEIKEAFSWGIVDGITTNPSLIKKAAHGKALDLAAYLEELLKAARHCPVSLEVSGEKEGKITQAQMVKEALALFSRFHQFNKNLNIKIPINPALSPQDTHQFDGLKAIKELASQNIPVNATLIMTPYQVLLAAKAGARYISPFLGRIDDYNGQGLELLKDSLAVLRPYHFQTELIAASIRNLDHVFASAPAGAHIATLPFSILNQMISHPKTYEGVKKFKEDLVLEYQNVLSP